MPVHFHPFLPLAVCLLCASTTAHAATLNVPAQYATIQAGINAAVDGDTVLVADGTYTGDGNRDIDFGGKNITVKSVHGQSKTIIDCGGYYSTDGSGNHRGFYIHLYQRSAVIDGFTIKNGYTTTVEDEDDSGLGGGILVDVVIGNLIVTNCTLSANTADVGGGIDNFSDGGDGSILMTNCTLTANTAANGGGGGGMENIIYNGSASIGVTNCNVSENMADLGGGGIENFSVGGAASA